MGRLRNITEMSGALANGGFVTLVHPNNHWPDGEQPSLVRPASIPKLLNWKVKIEMLG